MEEAHTAYSVLPALLTLGPIAAAVFVRPLGRRSDSLRNGYAVLVTALALLGAAALIPSVAAHERIGCTIPMLLGEIVFVVDPFGMLFALFAGLLWFCSTLYSLDYMKHEENRDRYHTASLIVLGAMMGVVTAGDLVTLYLFFEVLGLVAFLLVIHTETDEAKAAGIKYLWMTVAGGFALVAGILLTYELGGTGLIAPIPFEEGTEVLRWTAAGLMVLGFGVKAGMLPVHVWLPDAHPVAPSPASALLSGVMIKAGAYGIFRTVEALFRPPVAEHLSEELWHFTTQLGLVVFWIGIATMFLGVSMALLQSNAKRMLAYHSVSQMGFILAGIGAAGYLGPEAAMGVAGGLYHALNHAIFKGALFLGVGAVFFRTGELDMYKLGGLWKKMPITFILMLIAAAGITGVPLFNGFVSKSLIHHSITEAFELHELASIGVAEKIFMLTCGGTACSFIKLISFVFLGKPKREYGPEVVDAPPRMLTAMGILGVATIVLGIAPQLVINGVMVPGLELWGLEVETLEHYLEAAYLSPADLMSVVVAFGIGILIFVVGMKTGLFHAHFPVWMSIDWWYEVTLRAVGRGLRTIDVVYEAGRAATSRALRRARVGYRSTWSRLDRANRRMVTTFATGAPGPRDQHLIQHAYVELERERQATVRFAVSGSIHDGEPAHADASQREHIDAVRQIASYMAGRLCHERLGVVTDFVNEGRGDEIAAVFDRVAPVMRGSRSEVARTAEALAERRMAGENVLREISAAVNHVLSAERFDRALLAAVASGSLEIPAASTAGGGLPSSAPAAAALKTYRGQGLSSAERAGMWFVDIARIAVNAVTQERSGWLAEQHITDETVISTRMQIQRYARDMSLNVAVIVGILLVFVVAIVAKG